MNWFEGSIGDAIHQAKTSKAVFIVFVTGVDEQSTKMSETWDHPDVSRLCRDNGCVALKMKANSEACGQFSQIYPVIVVPSSYFIGVDGVPLEVKAGYATPEEFTQIVQKVVEVHKQKIGSATVTNVQQNQSPSTSAKEISEAQTKSEPSAQSEKHNAQEETEVAAGSVASSSSSVGIEEKMERARQLLEEKQRQKLQKEKEEAKRKEVERRQLGKDTANLKQWQKEQEIKNAMEERRKEKEENRKARERIRQEIARDRAEKNAKHQKEVAEREAAKSEAVRAKLEEERKVKAAADMQKREKACIQFRLPDGSKFTEEFPSHNTLRTVNNFVAQNVQNSLGPFVMKTTFPKRQFGEEDMSRTLLDLELVPSSVIIVLPGKPTSQVSSGGSGGGVIAVLLGYLAIMWGFICNFLFGTPSRTQEGSLETQPPVSDPSVSTSARSNRPKTAYKRRTPASTDGNIHRFRNDDDDDDDDETATWNGNSTQQM